MNPDAPPFIPTFTRAPLRRHVYSRAILKSLERDAVKAICEAPLTDVPSLSRVPVGFAALLTLPSATEWLNVAHVQLLVRRGRRSARHDVRRDGSRDKVGAASEGKKVSCHKCQQGPGPCAAIRDVVAAAVRRAASDRLGAALLQPGDVVRGLLQMALVFEARQSSLRLRALAERCPDVVDRVRQFLCGEGFHLPLPRVTAHQEWKTLNLMLKFDWIRDSRTRIFTEISKRWKKRHTQFEQFVYFFEYRDDRPVYPVKNMLTQSTKPVLVSVLSGDVLAVVLLARLGFFVPPDYYWDIFAFFEESLLRKSRDKRAYHLMRHLCLHLAERQSALRGDVFNPILPPREYSRWALVKEKKEGAEKV